MKFPLALLHSQWALLAAAATQVPFHEYVLAPTSRVISPASIYQTGGNVGNAAALLTTSAAATQNNQSTSFAENRSYVTLDFGKNIAGRVGSTSTPFRGRATQFSESSMYISTQYCDAVTDGGFDLPQWFNDTTPGHYEAGQEFQRGAFRYLTIVHNTTGTIDISNVTVYWTTSPEMEDPAAYTGYFHSDSEKLNRVWYAGAYTNQICSADPTTGVALGAPVAGWYYNYTISSKSSLTSATICLHAG
jgi:hypothetical protein